MALLFFLCNLLVFVWAAPVPNTEKSLNWAPSPASRGSLSILFSCAAALGICVWTGVRLNVDPIEQKPYIDKRLGRSVWAMIALLAPDIVLAIALHQFLVSIQYHQAVNEWCTDKYAEDPKQRKKMKLKTAFFAIMGGFCVEFNTIDGPRSYSLMIDDISNIGMMDRIYDYPLSDIDDKIAKLMPCFQCGWILLQCFGRQVQGLYITLLEINTAAHVLVAIVMYGIWWKKPVDIDKPITIDRRGMDQYAFSSTFHRNVVQLVLDKALVKMEDGNNNTETAGCGGEVEGTRMAAVLCQSVKVAPETIASLVKRIPDEIGLYFRDARRRDISDGVREHYMYISLPAEFNIPPTVMECAYRAAFSQAHNTAFEVAHVQIYDTISRISAPDVSGSGKRANSFDAFKADLRVELTTLLHNFQQRLRTEFSKPPDGEDQKLEVHVETVSLDQDPAMSFNNAPNQPHTLPLNNALAEAQNALDEARNAIDTELEGVLGEVLLTEFNTAFGKAKEDLEMVLAKRHKDIPQQLEESLGKARENLLGNFSEPTTSTVTAENPDNAQTVPRRALAKALGKARIDLQKVLDTTWTDLEEVIQKAVQTTQSELRAVLGMALEKAQKEHPTELANALDATQTNLQRALENRVSAESEKPLDEVQTVLSNTLDKTRKDLQVALATALQEAQAELPTGLTDALEKTHTNLRKVLARAFNKTQTDFTTVLASALDKAQRGLPTKLENLPKLKQVLHAQPTKAEKYLRDELTDVLPENPKAPGHLHPDVSRILYTARTDIRTELGKALAKVPIDLPTVFIQSLDKIQKTFRTTVENILVKSPAAFPTDLMKSFDIIHADFRKEVENTLGNTRKVLQVELATALDKARSDLSAELSNSRNNTTEDFKGVVKKVVEDLKMEFSNVLDKARLRKELTKALDKACMSTRIPTFRAAFKAAFDAASWENQRKEKREQQHITGTNSETALPAAQNPQSMEQQHAAETAPPASSSLYIPAKAAVRAAHAATRAASRQAVCRAAIDAVLGKATAADIAGSAFDSVLTRLCAEADIEPQRPDIDEPVKILRKAVHNAFRQQYRTGTNRENIGSDVNSTIALIKEATIDGIHEAASKKVKTIPMPALKLIQTELSTLQKDNNKSDKKESFLERLWRLRNYFVSAGKVVSHQLVHVPGLFWVNNDSKTVSDISTGTGTKGSPTRRGSDNSGASEGRPRRGGDKDILFTESWKRWHRIRMLLFVCVAGLFYGGLHISKWKSSWFPSPLEQLLWRISCCIGSATIVPVAILASIPFVPWKSTGFFGIFYTVLCVLSWVVFLAARTYIIVESFISLRALPADAFEVVQWSASIPHI